MAPLPDDGAENFGSHILPVMSEAAKEAEGQRLESLRDSPSRSRMMRVIRAAIDKSLVIYGQLPSYRAMLDRRPQWPGDRPCGGRNRLRAASQIERYRHQRFHRGYRVVRP